ncbi:K(+) efflux antiporter 2, chloroplastic-like [Zingiber officinale]|uniref:K(+) efflux antiporter 2, chloroplastic-like n=1 Tax=Zingiber officinale TaxID=94328 RepID=UPI001C4D8840|nr:K(+) efflux antiporter 2, chloroplastic-like [Zingiber officinale]XP_042458984.1 K(+) efflux antiporter 2, chloroplastic-like [Zingiber officinale]
MMDLACGVRTPSMALDRGIGSGYLRLGYRGRSRYSVHESRVHIGTGSLGRKRCGLRCIPGEAHGRGWADLFSFSEQRGKVYLLSHRKLLNRSMLLSCHSSDSMAYIDASREDTDLTQGEFVDEHKSDMEESEVEPADDSKSISPLAEEKDACQMDEPREMLQKAIKELQAARINSAMFEEKALKISETAIALKDKAEHAWDDVNSAVSTIQEIIIEEDIAKEAVHKATMALSMAEARLQLAQGATDSKMEQKILLEPSADNNNEQTLLSAQEEIRSCKETLESCDKSLKHIQIRKQEHQKEVERLREIAENAQLESLKAEEDVLNIMLLAEKAVAFEVEATQHVNDAELALQRAEKASTSTDASEQQPQPSEDQLVKEETIYVELAGATIDDGTSERDDVFLGDVTVKSTEEVKSYDEMSDKENGKLILDSVKDADMEVEKSKAKKQEQKDLIKDSPPSLYSPKTLLKKSSRFFSASFFSFHVEDEKFTPASVFHGLVDFAKKQAPKLVIGILFAGLGAFFISNRAERTSQLFQQPDIITIEEVASSSKPMVRAIRKIPKKLKKLIEHLPQQEINEEEASLFDMLWLLLASVIFVPAFQKIPGGSPVLGYLAAGILIGPYGLSIIHHVHGTKAIAEFGVVFLLFNIGLELSVERLSSMKKYVFGLGSSQVLVTAVVVGLVAYFFSGLLGPAAIVIGNGLALSSTAVVLQVLQERGESTSRHGRATFSVLLFQDLAVVVLLILIPLISPNSSKGGMGLQAIAEALGLAAVKAIVAITAIIAGGRLLLRPIYKQIAENQNAEIFSANTLLVILGTSLLTARAGLSMALGAFLAGLLLAETEFSLQVESDIAPYRGLLLGLFFMTVGMSIDPKLLLANFPVIMGALGLLIAGKTLVVALLGRLFGISTIAAIRVALLLAPGGEFAFVAFGEAVNQGILSSQLSSLLFLVVGISMALTPWLAAGGQLLASRFEQHDVRSLLPVESETDDLQDHIIICGFGRIGQIIAQLLSERLIPFVALDVRSDRVAVGRALGLPVYFGDAGSKEVLHKVGAERACAAAIALDTPGANYRTVWALSKYFPNVKTFVRAHDVDHGINLEKAGASAVVPETLEPSLQLAAAVLEQAKLPTSEIAATINEFRSRHLAELTELLEANGNSLGYGFSRALSKPKPPSSDSDENEVIEGALAI